MTHDEGADQSSRRPRRLVPPSGLEPETHGLKVHCSTN